MTEKTFYYAPKAKAREFIDLGWIAHGSLEGTHHGQYAILVEWARDGEPEFPTADHKAGTSDA